jgi:NO-binding membrane sensor protein with MHYT domain
MPIVPSDRLAGIYDYRLVALSILISALASYAALDLGGRVTASRGSVRGIWLMGDAVAMEMGIWPMHYIGMLAYSLPVANLRSEINSMSWRKFLSAMLATPVMHYTGMAAASFRPTAVPLKRWFLCGPATLWSLTQTALQKP